MSDVRYASGVCLLPFFLTLTRLPGGCNYVLTQKETEDVIAAVMRSDELVQATSV